MHGGKGEHVRACEDMSRRARTCPGVQGPVPVCKDVCGTQREECLHGVAGRRHSETSSGHVKGTGWWWGAHVGLVPMSVQGTSVQRAGPRAREKQTGARRSQRRDAAASEVGGGGQIGAGRAMRLCKVKHRPRCRTGTGAGVGGWGGVGGLGGSVVLLRLLPLGHPVFLTPAGQEAAGLVTLLLPDPHRVVLGHDPVVAGPLEEVALGGEGGERVSAGLECDGERDPRGGEEQRQREQQSWRETPQSPLCPIWTL